MSGLILGVDKRRPSLALVLDNEGGRTMTIALSGRVDPERFFIGESDGNGGVSGRVFDIAMIERTTEVANTALALLSRFGKVPCPICGARLELDEERQEFQCTNPSLPTMAGYRHNKPCPFKASMDYFLESEETGEKSADED